MSNDLCERVVRCIEFGHSRHETASDPTTNDTRTLGGRVAKDTPEGAFVILGVGLPTKVANALSKESEVILHNENGLLGMGPAHGPKAKKTEICSMWENKP